MKNEHKSRTLSELLQVMLDNKSLFPLGLCHWNTKLHVANLITTAEYQYLDEYIENNRPKKVSWWWKSSNRRYYWRPGKLYPRIKWIKHHIKRLNSKA